MGYGVYRRRSAPTVRSLRTGFVYTRRSTGFSDDFNRASLGSDWTNSQYGFGSLEITSNVVDAPATSGAAIFNGVKYTDVDVRLDLSTVGGGGTAGPVVFARSTWDGTNATGYRLRARGDGLWEIDKYTGSGTTRSNLATSAARTMANGDSMRLKIVGSRITAYHKRKYDAEWVEVASATDADYTIGYCGMGAGDTTMRIDNFASSDAVGETRSLVRKFDSILDNFDRGSLGSGWTTPAIVSGGSGGIIIDSGSELQSNSGNQGGYWNANTFGPDCEAFVVVTQSSGTAIRLWIRLVDTGTTTAQGYCIQVDAVGNTIKLIRRDTGQVNTQLASVSQAVSSGDAIGIRCIGTKIEGWYRPIGGVWQLLLVAEDATYNAAGYIGLSLGDENGDFDNFGGGNVASNPGIVAATSTMSGAVSRIKAVTPATINATSTVGGNVAATKRVSSATISATSTVSGNVAATKRVAPATISATSTVSGNVAATKRIVPATISATSTVSGNVSATKRITPATVTATSTVSGSLRAIRAVIPTTISATSTVSGNVTATKRVIPTTISATSTVSGSVVALRRIAPTTISATSTVSGSLRVIRAILPTTISATSTVSGAVTRAVSTKDITPATISATSTMSGAIMRLAGIAPASISATSTVSGNVAATKRTTPATIDSTSTVSGSIRVVRAILPATISATSTVSGSVTATKRIVPTQISATSTVSGTVVALRRIAPATISATSTVSGNVTATKRIVTTTISATSTVSGALVAFRRIAPTTISATSTVSGNVTATKLITTASVSATSTVSGAIVSIRRIAPTTISATSTVSGNVTATKLILPSQIDATCTVSGVFTKTGSFTGNIAATSTVSGALVAYRAITPATINATSTVSGSVTATKLILLTTISATSTVSGAVIAYRRITPAIISATSTLSGDIVGIRAITPAIISATSTVSGAVYRIALVTPANILATSTVSGQIDVRGITLITMAAGLTLVPATVKVVMDFIEQDVTLDTSPQMNLLLGNTLESTSTLVPDMTKLSGRSFSVNEPLAPTMSQLLSAYVTMAQGLSLGAESYKLMYFTGDVSLPLDVAMVASAVYPVLLDSLMPLDADLTQKAGAAKLMAVSLALSVDRHRKISLTRARSLTLGQHMLHNTLSFHELEASIVIGARLSFANLAVKKPWFPGYIDHPMRGRVKLPGEHMPPREIFVERV